MREIDTFLDGIIAKNLAEICTQTKTAAAWQAQEFLNEAGQKTSKIFILTEAEDNKKTVLGFCAVRFVFESAEITNFAVAPAYQRKHLGTELFAHTLNFLKERGVKDITLEVASSNTTAQAFYKKFNFTCVSTRKKFYNMYEDALILKLCL